MPMYAFGSGNLVGTPLTDAYGNPIAVGTPRLFGVLQDISVDISFDTKMLYGQNQFPVYVGRGKGKVSFKAKFGQFNGAIINDLFFGQTLVSGLVNDYIDTTGAVIPATPFTITPTPPGAGAWASDLGVRDASGNNMTKVASGPTTGQYSVSAGAYLFAAADTGKTVFINYGFTGTSTVAKSSIVQNIAMGAAPTFQADFSNQLNGNGLSLKLFSCISSKLSLPTKQDDFMIQEFDADGFADPLGRILQWGTSQ